MDTIKIHLKEELEKFKEAHPMTPEELEAIESWVNEGNSVYDNPSLIYGENGYPLDFLAAYRDNENTWNTLNSMSEEERESYLAELHGKISYEKLKEKYDVINYEHAIYYKVLNRHGLITEAEKLIKLGKQPLDKYIKEGEELPFKD